ncbi:MAG TPA: chemotaxis protein CheW [bacterium]|nr:chemotaxis protein CheW [bacterium]
MEELTKTKGNVKTTDNLRRAADIANDMDIEQLVGFRLSNEEFGVPIIQVQEINRLESITKVPNAPSFIEGVSNLRGNVIPVICLRKRFSMPEKENDDKTRLIIVDIKGNKTGLIVDSVSEVLRMPKKNIENTPNVILSSVDAEFMAGIGKLDNGKSMVILLNLQKLLSDTETKELAQVAKKDKAAKN